MSIIHVFSFGNVLLHTTSIFNILELINNIYNHGHNILRLSHTLPNFLQVKRSVIISNKHGIYELSQELRKGSRLRILGNKGRCGKSQNFIEL